MSATSKEQIGHPKKPIALGSLTDRTAGKLLRPDQTGQRLRRHARRGGENRKYPDVLSACSGF